MTAAEIKKGMSGTPWEHTSDGIIDIIAADGYNVVQNIPPDDEDYDTDIVNAAAITTAVNATYGQGIDPTQVKAMYDLLGEISAWTSMNVAPDAKQIRDMKADIDKLLTAAKL